MSAAVVVGSSLATVRAFFPQSLLFSAIPATQITTQAAALQSESVLRAWTATLCRPDPCCEAGVCHRE